MVDAPVTCDIETSVTNEVGTIHVVGDLDFTSAPWLISIVRDLARAMVRRIELDCKRVDFVDSAGVRALIVGRNEARGAGADIELVGTSPAVRRVLDITGLAPILATS